MNEVDLTRAVARETGLRLHSAFLALQTAQEHYDDAVDTHNRAVAAARDALIESRREASA